MKIICRFSKIKDKYNLVFDAYVDVFFQKDIFKFYENNKPFLGVSIEDIYLSEACIKIVLLNNYGEKIFKTL